MGLFQLLGPIIKNIPWLYEMGKKILKFVGNLNLQDTPEINQKSSVQDISKMAETLDDIRANVVQNSSPVIQDIKGNIGSYVEELNFLMEDKMEVLKKYNFSSRFFEKTLDKLNDSVQEFWNKEISKQISFDNAECRSILALPAGKKKEVDMQNFITKVIQETTIAYTKYLEEILHRLYDDFEADIEDLTKRLEINLDTYKQMDMSVLNKDSALYKQTIEQAQTKVLICDEIMNRLGK